MKIKRNRKTAYDSIVRKTTSHKDGLSEILLSVKQKSRRLVYYLQDNIHKNPQLANVLNAALGMTAFWDAVQGVKDITASAYKTFRRLFTKIEKYKSSYSGSAIISNLVSGIGRLGLAFIKFVLMRKINNTVHGNYAPMD